ncbi:MAG: DUF938 domain-containing protein [Myxococcota bacterium]
MKRTSPAALRNRVPLAARLQGLLDEPSGEPQRVLEVASGTGIHAVHFVAVMPGVVWQPTDPSSEALESVEAHRRELADERLLPAARLDAAEASSWRAYVGPYDAIFCANMVHIAPWSAAVGLFAHAPSRLRPGALLLLYGPFRFEGRFTAESNAAFDASLRARNATWGVRDVEALKDLAGDRLTLERVLEMPANNHLLVWRTPS